MANTYNPIISKEDAPILNLFMPVPTPEPGVALVLYKEGQKPREIWPDDKLTPGEIKWGRFKIIYRVDVSEYSFTISSKIPCDSDAFDFLVEVQGYYSVISPVSIVERNVNDVRSLVEPGIIEIMRNISRKYKVEQSALAENAIKKALEKQNIDLGIGINRIVVKLSLEQGARDHIRNLKDMERERERELKGLELEKERDKIKAELEKLRSEHEIELIKEKSKHYSALIQGGLVNMLAEQLSRNPDDIGKISKELREHRQTEMEFQLDALRLALENDALENGIQLDELGKHVLTEFVNSIKTKRDMNLLEGKEKQNALPDSIKETKKQTSSEKDDNQNKE